MLKTLRQSVENNPLYVLMEAQCHRVTNALNHPRKMERKKGLKMDLQKVEMLEITVLAVAAAEEMEVMKAVAVAMEERAQLTFRRCLADNI
jgi:hypothetical protein